METDRLQALKPVARRITLRAGEQVDSTWCQDGDRAVTIRARNSDALAADGGGGLSTLFEVSGRAIPATALAMLLAFCASCVGLLATQAAVDLPRVLFDEGHHNFHTPSRSYRPYASLLESDGFAVHTIGSTITAEALASADVFVSVSPLPAPRGELIQQARALNQTFRTFEPAARPAFSDAEVGTLEAWVRSGGGLMLVLDHPPYAGAGRALVAAFGADVRNATRYVRSVRRDAIQRLNRNAFSGRARSMP